MEVLVKKLHEKAVIPHKAYPSDFCYDVTAVSEEEIAPNIWRYGIGLAFQLVGGDDTRVYDIDFRPRSSVWKTGMVLSNSVGTIDANYRGEISAVFYHVNTSLPRYKVGDRIGQIKLGITQALEFVVTDELDLTDRGGNGYGSSGK